MVTLSLLWGRILGSQSFEFWIITSETSSFVMFHVYSLCHAQILIKNRTVFGEKLLMILIWHAAVTLQENREYYIANTSSHIRVWTVNMSETGRRNTELLLGDRLSFVFGLLVIILGEYFILREPHLFTYFYTFLLTVLVAKRYQNNLF